MTPRPSKYGLGKAPTAAESPDHASCRPARLYTIALILAFGPLAAGLIANVLNDYGLVSEAGTWGLFRTAPIISLFTMPVAVGVMFAAVAAMRRERR